MFINAAHQKGVEYLFQSNWAEALIHFDLARTHNPEANEILVDQGFALTFLGEKERALTDFSTLIDWQPENAQHWWKRSFCYAYFLETEKAKADFEKAIRLDPLLEEKKKTPFAYRLEEIKMWQNWENTFDSVDKFNQFMHYIQHQSKTK